MRTAVTVALALVLLQVALGAYYWLPDPSASTVLAPTWEFLALVLVVACWEEARAGALAPRRALRRVGRLVRASSGDGDDDDGAPAAVGRRQDRRDRAFVAVVVIVTALYLLLGFAQGFARREFGYNLVLPLHVPYVPDIFKMMYDGEPLGMFILYNALLALGLALAIAVIHGSVRALVRCARAPRHRVALVGASVVYFGVAGLLMGVNDPLTAKAYEQVDLAMNLQERLDETARGMEVENARLRRMSPFGEVEDPPSVYLFVIESYGAAVFRDPDFPRSAQFAERHQRALEKAGYAVRTSYLEAPVFGGSSWMAHGTMLCGVTVQDQKRYESLHEAAVTCLPEIFNRAGYRTIVAAANTTYLDDRYERTFPFDAYYFKDDFGYKGTRYGWSYVPDQYVIKYIDEHEIEEHPDAPKFVNYQLTTSHHPWSKVPPYVRDWDSIKDGSEHYAAGHGIRFQNRFVRGSQYKRGYWRSIGYVMRSVVQYVKTLPEDDALIVILGDHQARKPIARMNDSTWWVPVHIASRDADAIARFADLGYVPGMTPPDLDPTDASQRPDALKHLARHLFDAYADAR